MQIFLRSYGLFCLLWICVANACQAHEARPAVLNLTEFAQGQYQLDWKLPVNNGAKPKVDLKLPKRCKNISPVKLKKNRIMNLRQWSVDCGKRGLDGATLRFVGLELTLVDVLVQLNGLAAKQQFLIKPKQSALTINQQESSFPISAYFVLGVEHIAEGIDHLLFVFCLLLLIKSRWSLVKAITAFTLAHSISLFLSVKGYVYLPAMTVEACIALSIAFLAREIYLKHLGKYYLSARKPWLLALIFGLIHGFGFAGALKDIGLPVEDLVIALLLFNLGVEFGQLIFVVAVFLLLFVTRHQSLSGRRNVVLQESFSLNKLLAYGVGTLSMFWFLERVAPILTMV